MEYERELLVSERIERLDRSKPRLTGRGGSERIVLAYGATYIPALARLNNACATVFIEGNLDPSCAGTDGLANMLA